MRIWRFARRLSQILTTVAAASFCSLGVGEEPRAGESAAEVVPAPPAGKTDVLTMKTLGGRLFWGDVEFFRGWRIQQNVFSKHFRLLDEADHRHASGTLEECQARLAEIRKERNLPPMQGRGVILIHGITRSSKSMKALAKAIEAEGLTAIPFDYPSTQVPVPESAEYLHRVISSLEGLERIDFVVHSMGGLIVRSYLTAHDDPRLGRLTMLGVPNRGAEMADLLQRNFLFRAVLGPAGQQLVSHPEGLISSLPIPRLEFAVIAGARGTPDGWNPLIPGDDDGTVTVASTRLPGAADFLTVPALHTFMLSNPAAVEASVRFLTTGRLRADQPAQPIVAAEPEAAAATKP
ncbi:hypothetical protein [Planctellipticum variicoloris]|uniref:hypothetical protein n=1 Tax=Planctellipticum variicoloris TaxID=3064265 RepID=UPI002C2F9BA4|nr:hypothetical protein SH412_000176 [Planctomycetaceae bacterium SH412]HTN01020.1 hypothetical protein [Planctomycetaceae bacterium]